MRPEVQEFMRICEALTGLALQNELIHEEHGIVLNCVRVLEKEVIPAPPPPTEEDAPLAATLSNLPLID